MDKYIGKRLDGRYEINEVIGVGGMAVVYKAYDCIEDRVVAVKILKDEFIANDEFVRRFKNESKAIAVLSHPNIVKVYDVSLGDNIQYIVMEYIDGITLKEYIQRLGTLPWKDALHFTVQILSALQHAHDKGIVHRDVKPQNIMLLRDGTIKVADFGIARFARSEQRTITDKAIGSVHYISPEQARGDVIDEKADLYSVGVLLYEMLTGCLPFQADSAVSVAIMQLQNEPKRPREINPSIPVGLEQITMRAMRKNPNKRYHSDAEMLRDLKEFKRDPGIVFNYDEIFTDDEPTRYIGNLDAAKKIDELYDINSDVDEDEEKGTSIVPILAGIAAALVIGLGILAWIFLPKIFSERTPDVVCPNLIGMDYQKALDDYKNDLEIYVGDWEFNDDYAYGQVIEQEYEAQKALKKGTKVKIIVSKGKKTMTMPDVYDHEYSDAVRILKDNDLKTTMIEVSHEEIEAGNVIRTVPQRGAETTAGTTVKVYVSTGKPIKYVTVPDIKNISLDRAEEKLEEAGLKRGEITYRDSVMAKDTVIEQSKNSGAQIGYGSAVDVVVSTGKAPTSQTVVSYSYNIKVELPSGYENAVSHVKAVFAGKTVFSKEKVSSKTVDVVFDTTVESGTLKIYVNDTVYQEYTLNKNKATLKKENELPEVESETVEYD